MFVLEKEEREDWEEEADEEALKDKEVPTASRTAIGPTIFEGGRGKPTGGGERVVDPLVFEVAGRLINCVREDRRVRLPSLTL